MNIHTKHLYVCLWSNGHIKVGMSSDPEYRIGTHCSRAAAFGIKLTRHAIFECVGPAAPAEAALIDKCIQHASEQNLSEWFAGLDFDICCGWAKDASNLEFSSSRVDQKQAAAVLGDTSSTRLAELLNQVSVKELAEAAGVSTKTIYRLRHQKNSPTLAMVERLTIAAQGLIQTKPSKKPAPAVVVEARSSALTEGA